MQSELSHLLQVLSNASTLDLSQLLPTQTEEYTQNKDPLSTSTITASINTDSSTNTAAGSIVVDSSEKNEYTLEDYLIKGRTITPAKRRFRHILKKSATETDIWGKGTLKDLNPGKLKHIHDRVCSQCPAFKGHEKELDEVLGKCLIEAKHYQKRRGEQSVTDLDKKTKKHMKRRKTRDQLSSGSSSETDSEKMQPPKYKTGYHHKGSHGVKSKLSRISDFDNKTKKRQSRPTVVSCY